MPLNIGFDQGNSVAKSEGTADFLLASEILQHVLHQWEEPPLSTSNSNSESKVKCKVRFRASVFTVNLLKQGSQ
ncbi:hypothetical protein D3C74_388800 [compost metagenome]